MLYTNSEGVQMETASIEKHHLVNALIKNVKDQVLHGGDSEKRMTAMTNVSALKSEIIRRLTEKEDGK